jgi:DNA polymerase-1
MELCGIGFNISNHRNLITNWQGESERLEADIFDRIGRELNINSGKQMGAWLREVLTDEELEIWTKTEKGQLSTSTPTFKTKEHLHEIIPKIVEYRHVSKRISSFGEGMYKFIDVPTNRLYGSFSLGTTVTGRMASREPNMQNMPRDGFRSLFCAKEGYSLVGLDYSQQELRVAAIITGDEELLRIYQDGGDVHTNTASEILKIPKDKIGKEQRQLAKAVIFGLLYGQGAKGLARYAKSNYGVDMTEQEAERHRASLFKLYKGLLKWQISTGRIVEITHKVRTPCGRERDFSREPKGYQYTAALNLPIQGAAAEITLSAVIRINEFTCDDCQLVNVVHDEILLEVKDNRVEEFALLAKEAMEKGFLDVFPDSAPYLKGLVESKIGKNWAETK